LCSSSFCQGVKVVVVVQKDTHTFFFFLVREISCCQVFCKVLYHQTRDVATPGFENFPGH